MGLRGEVMPPEIRNPDQKIDILLEFRIDRNGQAVAISEHLVPSEKHRTSPISDLST